MCSRLHYHVNDSNSYTWHKTEQCWPTRITSRVHFSPVWIYMLILFCFKQMVKLRLKSIKQTICSCFAVVAPARTLSVPEEEQQVVLFDQVTSGSNVEPNGLKTKLASLQTTLATCGYHFPFRCLTDGIFSRQLNCFTRTLFVKEKKRNQLQCEVILSRFLFFVWPWPPFPPPLLKLVTEMC